MKPRLPSTISWKLLAGIVPIVVFAVGLIVVGQYWLARREILRSIRKEIETLSQQEAVGIDGLIAQRENDLITLSETPLIADYYHNVEFQLAAEAETYRRELCRYLQGFARRSGVYAEMLYLDARGLAACHILRGEIREPGASHRNAPYFARAASSREAWWTSRMQEVDGIGRLVYFSKPVRDELGGFKGALVLAYDVGQIEQLLATIGRGGRATAFLQTPVGRLPPAPGARATGDVLVAQAQLRRRPWAFVIEAPLDAYLGPLRRVRNVGISIALTGLAVLGAALLFLVRSITRPIAELVTAARRIGGGDLAYRIEAPGGDELGTLSNAFNEMAERLESNRRMNLQLQSQLIQAEKLSAVGTLISAVAHELSNPINVVLGLAQVTLRQADLDPRKALEDIAFHVQRSRKIIENLLFFGRQSKHERRPVDLNEVAKSAVDLLRYRLKKTENVALELSLAPDLPKISADFQQIVQVLFNLINNACDAMEDQPTRRLSVRTGVDGEAVYVEVEDTGAGIPVAARSRIFEPFFTTKEAGRGTGLGLSVSRQIVDQHGGGISFESREGAGTRFRVRFPVAAPPRVEEAEGFEQPTQAVPGKRVLVVDDEAELAELMARILRVDGDEVAVAHSGADGLRLLSAEPFDLIISDMEMEDTKGQDLFAELERRGIDPRRKILFVTGDILNAKVLNFLTTHNCAYLVKPFEMSELQQAARKLLAGLPLKRTPH